MQIMNEKNVLNFKVYVQVPSDVINQIQSPDMEITFYGKLLKSPE